VPGGCLSHCSGRTTLDQPRCSIASPPGGSFGSPTVLQMFWDTLRISAVTVRWHRLPQAGALGGGMAPNLEELILMRCHLGAEGARALAKGLWRKATLKLTLLDLSMRNNLGASRWLDEWRGPLDPRVPKVSIDCLQQCKGELCRFRRHQSRGAR
jgi:hypothetical protein